MSQDPAAQSATPSAKTPAKRPSSGGNGKARPDGKKRLPKLRHILFALILLPGIAPLLFSSSILIDNNRKTLVDQEKELLTYRARQVVGSLSEDLARRRGQIQQLGRAIVSVPGMRTVEQRLREPWVGQLLSQYVADHPELASFGALSMARKGLSVGATLPPQAADALQQAFDTSLRLGEPAYQFAVLSQREPAVAMAVPVPTEDGNDALVIQTLLPLDFAALSLEGETFDVNDFFLINRDGSLLWSGSEKYELQNALRQTSMVTDFARNPLISVTTVFDLEVAGEREETLARVVQVQETGWGLVAHKASDAAFEQVSNMIRDTVLSSVLAVMLALFFAIVATRWFSRPIQKLAETSHEIAAGKFGRRVPVDGLVSVEIADMATDFNRMGDYVEKYIQQLRKAAEANRSLFISSIRAFAAAIDAKDPYTRGHSERVAAYSRAIARYLGLPKDMQEKVWIAGVLHDVGKIGVQDRVLLKQGVLTPEEFEQMKLHPVIGADIIEPISALTDMIPGIRWHHEAWNGTGYPDKLQGEQIPLMARIIGVADTFDAITTNRPYQTASTPEYAIETIKKLTGTKFDQKVVQAFLLAWEAERLGTRPRAEGPVAAAPAPSGAPGQPAQSPQGQLPAGPPVAAAIPAPGGPAQPEGATAPRPAALS